jgi:hypothetical protein
MKLPKLIPGKMNIPYIVCKPGYATGVAKPKRLAKVLIFNPVMVKIRRNERLVA